MAYPDRDNDPDASVLCWREGHVAHIRFNRPKALNALNLPMATALRAACNAIEADEQVRAVVIAGEGRCFLAGGDIVAMASSPTAVARELITEVHAALTILNRLRAPVIGQVHGAAAGAALGVLMACDLVAASEGAKFSIAFPGIGASADSSTTWGLPRVMGLRNALHFALLGEAIDATQACEWGLVSKVVPAEVLADTVGQWAARIAASAPLALGSIKRLLRTSLDRTLPEQLAGEAEAFLTCAASRDFEEGVAAFLGKRTPRFKGH